MIPFYDRSFIDHEFTDKRIEEEVQWLLLRALNTREVVGVIGSGVASAYGRPSWSRLIDEVQRLLLKRADEAKGLDKALLNSIRDAIEGVKQASRPGLSDPELLPLRAQLLRNAAAMLARAEETPPEEDAVQSVIKEMTKDDDFAAEQAWKGLFHVPPESPDKALWRSLDCVVGLALVVNKLRRVSAGVRSARARKINQALAELAKTVEALKQEGTARRLCADERILAPLLEAAAEALGAKDALRRVLLRSCASVKKRAPELIDGKNAHNAHRSDDFDPIRIIVEKLEIKRLLTTNYDFELELGLERLGFKDLPPTHDSPRQNYENALGERACAAVFNADTAADLASFAVHAHPQKYAVFHLHGRAAKGPGERLIITEPDYQAIYMREAPEARVMNEALTAVMAGNPLVFIGMGMQEGDFLRPLRRFLAGPGPRINRCVVALLPTEEDRARRAASALKLHPRYGVHTIYYGFARKRGSIRDDGEDDAPLYECIKALRELRTGQPDPGDEAKPRKPRQAFEHAMRQIRRLGIEANDPSNRLLWQAAGLARVLLSPVKLDEPVKQALGRFAGELDGRIRARALCQELNALAGDRRDWWAQWRELPRSRTFAHTIEEWSGAPEHVWRCNGQRAHRAYLGPREEPSVRNIRYRIVTDPAHSSENDKRLRDLIADLLEGAQAAQGRRIFIVHGAVGAGRGSLFHELADRFVKPRSHELPYAWGLLTNATFSTEYSSVIDGVIHFLWRCKTSRAAQYLDAALKTTHPKNLRREAVKQLLGKIELPPGKRGLFVIGGADLLFRSGHGDPKNSEIVDAIGAFLDDDTKKAPVDVVLICRSDHCHAIFGKTIDVHCPRQENVEVHFGRTRIVPEGPEGDTSPRGPRFSVDRVLKLEHRPQKLETVLGIEHGPEQIQSLNAILTGRFARSIVTRCTAVTAARGEDVEEFLVALADAQTKSDAARSMDVTIGMVLKQYRRLYKRDSEIDHELLEIILKHVAIMSGPVEVAVLARCPDIRQRIRKWQKRVSHQPIPEDDDEAFARLVVHVDRLVDHQLVFEIRRRDEFREGDEADPCAGEEIKSNDRFRRFAAHQSLQAFFFHQMGAPFLELGDARLFTVSLYASQGTRLPSPSMVAFHFLLDLLRELIGYPGPARAHPALRDSRTREGDICALRAAVSLARSAFSFAVVSRFSEFDQNPQPVGRHYGYLEEYRLLLRWMIFKAGKLGVEICSDSVINAQEAVLSVASAADELNKEWLSGVGQGELAAIHFKYRLNALYQDEITWLYNECAVVSLAQGNLYDALALLERAEASNDQVEVGDAPGPNGLRIRLNKALAEIERGNLKRANEILRLVWENSTDDPVVRAVARGYRGLAAHLRGRVSQAARHYESAIKSLRELGEGRAIAIFCKHNADLWRSRDPERCKRELADALAEAETARQQDLVYRIYVSLALHELESSNFSAELVSRILRRTEEARRYADTMEIYSLKAEALLVRALVMHRQGETHAAGEDAVTALSLANLHGQRIRAIFALMRLGEAFSARQGYESQGAQLLRAAAAMADRYESQQNRQRVEEHLLSHKPS